MARKPLITGTVIVIVLLLAAAIAIAIAVGVENAHKKKSAPQPYSLPKAEATTIKLVNFEDMTNAIQNQWLVSLRPEFTMETVLPSIESAMNNSNMPWNITNTFSSVNCLHVFCPDDVINSLMDLTPMREYGKYIERDRTVSLSLPPTQSKSNLATTVPWGLDRINQRDLPLDNVELDTLNGPVNGAGVSVYILDTGIRISHLEFGGRALATATFVNDGMGAIDCNGHGTHVAAVVGGRNFGVARGVTLNSVRVLDCTGSGSISSVVGGVDWVSQNAIKPAIASLSLGGISSINLDLSVKNAISSGVTFVVAAGNDNSDCGNTSPADVQEAITVAASTEDDHRASFSNFGSCVDVFAPGKDIISAWYTNDTATKVLSGTSMATPFVSGVSALYLQQYPNATPAEVQTSLVYGSTWNRIATADIGANSPNTLLYWPFTEYTGSTTSPPSDTNSMSTSSTNLDNSPCVLNSCQNETVYLGSEGAYSFHPNGNYFYSPKGGVFQAWLNNGITQSNQNSGGNNDFDLDLFTYVNQEWIKVASSDGTTSVESIYYSGVSGYYVWRVISFSGSGSYNVAVLNP